MKTNKLRHLVKEKNNFFNNFNELKINIIEEGKLISIIDEEEIKNYKEEAPQPFYLTGPMKIHEKDNVFYLSSNLVYNFDDILISSRGGRVNEVSFTCAGWNLYYTLAKNQNIDRAETIAGNIRLPKKSVPDLQYAIEGIFDLNNEELSVLVRDNNEILSFKDGIGKIIDEKYK